MMRRRLHRLFRWLMRRPPEPPPCAHHRETLDLFGGYALRWRCLDCAHTRMAGWVFVGVSNRQRAPWEHPDA